MRDCVAQFDAIGSTDSSAEALGLMRLLPANEEALYNETAEQFVSSLEQLARA